MIMWASTISVYLRYSTLCTIHGPAFVYTNFILESERFMGDKFLKALQHQQWPESHFSIFITLFSTYLCNICILLWGFSLFVIIAVDDQYRVIVARNSMILKWALCGRYVFEGSIFSNSELRFILIIYLAPVHAMFAFYWEVCHLLW